MRTFDLTPLYRNTVGFDRMLDLLDNFGATDAGGYPPYNIERLDENRYRVTLAVAGFGPADLEVEAHQNTLKISGARSASASDQTFLHQGIAARSFERRFQLADHVEIDGATLENGLLSVELRREVPEAMKPRRIAINGDGGLKVVKDASAA
ncbi:MAG: Hsp20 family protein [Parvularculaceae bacterium]